MTKKSICEIQKNLAFIDGQNLHLSLPWNIDYMRFRVYLREKLKVKAAYYFLGYLSEEYQDLYNRLQEAGFVLIFREHHENFLGKKKGNVDSDVVFEIMKSLLDRDFDKVVLVSGDGDYKKVVDYLIAKDRFGKIIFPNRKNTSSLYKKLPPSLFLDLGQKSIMQKLEKKKGSP